MFPEVVESRRSEQVKNRHYRAGLFLITLLGGLFVAAPGCDTGDTCPGVAGKLCDKACACGSTCSFTVAGSAVATQSKFLCVPEYTAQCGNQAGVDFAACSIALDTATCDEAGSLVLPSACTSVSGDGGAGEGGGGGASSSSSSSSSATGGK